MKRLLLLRHAKAVTGSSKAGDHGRALNERGLADAPRMGVAMHHKGYLPQIVLCSTATRTVETWEHVAPELGVKPQVEFVDALYLASAKTIANLARAISAPADTALIIGHNPGLEDLAKLLVRSPQSDAELKRFEKMSEKFPTAALAVIDFDAGSWSEIAAGAGELSDFLKPKDL